MDIKLAWLTGILEGEGTFGLNKSSGKRKHFTFSISITNTDLMILNECISILKNINVDTHLHKRKVYFQNRKVGYNLNITGIDNLIKITNAVIPYLIGQKKSQAELFLAFLNRRKSFLDRNVGNSKRRIAYDEIDNSYLKAFQALKSVTESVEINTPSIQKVKICKFEGCSKKHYSKGYCQKHYDKIIHCPRYKLKLDEDGVRTANIDKIADLSRNDLGLNLN